MPCLDLSASLDTVAKTCSLCYQVYQALSSFEESPSVTGISSKEKDSGLRGPRSSWATPDGFWVWVILFCFVSFRFVRWNVRIALAIFKPRAILLAQLLKYLELQALITIPTPKWVLDSSTESREFECCAMNYFLGVAVISHFVCFEGVTRKMSFSPTGFSDWELSVSKILVQHCGMVLHTPRAQVHARPSSLNIHPNR